MKKPKLNLWKFTGKGKEVWPVYKYLCYNDSDKEVVATDGHAMVICKSLYKEIEGESTVIKKTKTPCHLINRKGEVEHLYSYPNYKAVIQKGTEPLPHLTYEQSVQLLAQCKEIKERDKNIVLFIRFADRFFVNPAILEKMLMMPDFSFQFIKPEEGKYGSWPIKYQDNDITGVFMPYLPCNCNLEEITANLYTIN